MTPLSELGHRQAEALAAHFAVDVPPDVVYTSPLPRAAQTAGYICEKLGLEPISDSRLEEFELGTTSLDTLHEQPHLQFWKPEHGGEDGVTLSEFSARIAEFYDGVVRQASRTTRGRGLSRGVNRCGDQVGPGNPP